VLTGHGASVNVVRWGGENVVYTGSSDRTVKVWSGVDVRGCLQATLGRPVRGRVRQSVTAVLT